MHYNSDIDIELYTTKEKIGINNKNLVDDYIYELELIKKIKVSPTAYLFIFEYEEDIRNIIEVEVFSVFLFIGIHDPPTVPGTWNGTVLDEPGFQVRRKYTPIYIDVEKRQIHFLIRIYSQTEKFPDGGRFTRYLNKFLISETVSISCWKPNLKLINDNLIKALATKFEFDTLNLAAGGTGVTPFVRLLNYYQGVGVDINLIYCNKTLDEIMLKSLFDRFAQINKRLRLTYLVSEYHNPHSSQPGDNKSNSDSQQDSGYNPGVTNSNSTHPDHRVIKSRITREIVEAYFTNSENALTMFCGPPGFNDLMFEILQTLKFKNIHRV